jgi:hypothetical protein
MSNQNELLDIVHVDQSPLGCNITVKCPYKERSLSYAVGVTIPQPTEDPEIVFKECCYVHTVLADVNSNDDFKNDYSGFYHQRQLTNETVEFVLLHTNTGTEYPLNDGTFGKQFGFGSFKTNLKLTGYLVEWKKVLTEIGQGSFKVIKRITVAGVPVEFPSIVFTLKQYSANLADKTVRLDVVMNGLMEKSGVDFTGTGWKHSLRVPGFFGRREPQFEENNIVSRSFEKRQVSIQQTNEFKFQTNMIPDCVANEIWDFIILANHIYLNDYNLNNHSYDFIKFGAKFATNEGTQYGTTTRKARLNLVFTDKFENNLKRNYQ